MTNQAIKHIKVFEQSIFERLQKIIPVEHFQLHLNTERKEFDFVIANKSEQITDQKNQAKIIWLNSDNKTSEVIHQENTVGVLEPKLLDHEIGRVYLLRLLGMNSSLALEAQFKESGVSFKNFRLMDDLSLGYYSDMVVRESKNLKLSSVVTRSYLNSALSFLECLQGKNKVDFPVEVDYGAFKDCFVIQIHCAHNGLTKDDILDLFKKYHHDGSMSNISNLVDVLDIFSLEGSERLVIAGLWFSQSFKVNPSLFIHHIPRFQKTDLDIDDNKIEAGRDDHELDEDEALIRVKSIGLEDIEKIVVSGKTGEDENTAQWVRGLNINEDDITKVEGKFEIDDIVTRIKAGNEVSDEELWKFKKTVVVADLKERISISQGQVLPSELKTIIRNDLPLNDKQADEFLNVCGLDTYIKSEKKDKWTLKDQNDQKSNHEILKRDAQIFKMKKLIDRMKLELMEASSHKNPSFQNRNESLGIMKETHDRLVESKNKKIEELENRLLEINNKKVEAQLDDNERNQFIELKKDYENLFRQLETTQRCLSQTSENITTKVKERTERLEKEVQALKKQNHIAHQFMQTSKAEKDKLEAEIFHLKSERETLTNKVAIHESGATDETHGEELKAQEERVKELEKELKGLTDELKKTNLTVKKLDQKNRFLSSQLESAQKGSVGQGHAKKQNQVDRGQQLREAKMQKMIDALKETEDKLNNDLIQKKDEVNKLKSESTLLKNRIAELERKMSKYEKQAA